VQKKINILHIEDEYEDVDWLIESIQGELEEQDKDDDVYNATLKSSSGVSTVEWACYEISKEGKDSIQVDYYFARNTESAINLAETSFNLLVVDVLESGVNGVLHNRVSKNLEALNEKVRTNKIVLFTAYSGDDIDVKALNIEMIIRKDQEEKLENYIYKIIFDDAE
jgi:CheY-like chemotaxis protein